MKVNLSFTTEKNEEPNMSTLKKVDKIFRRVTAGLGGQSDFKNLNLLELKLNEWEKEIKNDKRRN